MEKIGEVPSVKNMQRDMNSLYNVGNRTPFLTWYSYSANHIFTSGT